MHLQSLELFGFKSFADKTVLDFHEGITAVVGPNGCGKSNVLDAIRWALGEQSAKSLRGDEMADVIFNGTDSRKPLGFAEVSLTFSDCEKELNIDWHEVRVTRRVYRDGNSEYLLNKTPCRLRDIQNLFADTGVARTAYSMMEQGKIDLILSSRPEDRRAVFEEAAGITKYKSQKREALRKLEATEANLLRIGDVIKEVKRQIGSLQRQAGKARRYQALHADLRVLDTHHAKRQLAALETDLVRSREEIEQIAVSEQATREKIDRGESDLAEERRAVDKIDIEIAERRAEAQRLQSEIGAHRSRIEFNRQRTHEFAELIERCRNDIAIAEEKRTQHAAQIKEADALVEQTLRLLQTKENELAGRTTQLTRLRTEREARQSERQNIGLSVSKDEVRVAALEDELASLRARRELTVDQIRRIDAEIEKAMRARDELVANVGAAHAATKDEQEKLQELLAITAAAEKNLRQEQDVLASSENDLREVERALAEKRSVLEVLRQLNERGEGLAAGSQAVLHGMDRPERFRSAVAGSLVSQLEVERKFVAAIEVALGRNLHAIVLKDGDTAAEIIERLTRKKLGQAALFVPRFASASHESVRKVLPAGALGWAMDKVVAPRSLEPLLNQLLNGVVIFPDLEKAVACKKNEPGLAMATLDGEFISAEGIVFGGSSEVRADSLLERKAQIAVLQKEETDCAARRESLLEKRDQIKATIEAAAQQLNETRVRHEAAQLAQSSAAARITLLEREQEEAARKIDDLKSDKATLEQQARQADEDVAELEKEMAALRERL
ncbi:MAG: chromosome segregation protein SMC, partial [Chthoniobacterales bacterium]